MTQQHFNDLEKAVLQLAEAIRLARLAAEDDSAPKELLHRLDAYEEICEKQAQYIRTLKKASTTGERAELFRQIGIINRLSRFIRDDARCLLNSLDRVPTPAVDALLLH